MVELQHSIDWIWGVVGIILFGIIMMMSIKLYKRFRESFRIIKHTFEKQGNNLDKHYLTRLEMKAYSKELWFKYPLLKKVPDKLILLLNYLSNNHGQNWIVGVLFTLGVTIISFIWIIEPIDNGIEFNLSYKNITKTINYNAQLMNITNWSFEAFGISYDKTSYTKLFISKIFITYGYYQTISAFRKFNRK